MGFVVKIDTTIKYRVLEFLSNYGDKGFIVLKTALEIGTDSSCFALNQEDSYYKTAFKILFGLAVLLFCCAIIGFFLLFIKIILLFYPEFCIINICFSPT